MSDSEIPQGASSDDVPGGSEKGSEPNSKPSGSAAYSQREDGSRRLPFRVKQNTSERVPLYENQSLSGFDIYQASDDSSFRSVSENTEPVAIAVTRNDDAWDESRTDSLLAESDARALARLAVLRDFQPPLAVGILGSWGSGKSFFMRLIHQHVERIKARNTFGAPEAASKQFHEKVVQIRFNAWHYAETNLWASLVDHLFQELARATNEPTAPAVLGQLHTARELTLDAMRELILRTKDVKSATDAYHAAKEDAEVLRYRIDPVGACRAAIVEIFNDEENTAVQDARDALDQTVRNLGIGELAVNAGKLTDAGAELLNEGLRGRQIVASAIQQTGTLQFVAWLTLFVFAGVVAIPWALHEANVWLQMFSSDMQKLVADATGVVVVLTGALTYLLGPAKSAITTLRKAKEVLDTQVQAKRKKLEEEVLARGGDVATADVRLKAASEHLKASIENLASVDDDLRNQTPANRLINFVRSRATDGTYAQHLGLISAVRRDFEQLSTFLDVADVEQSGPAEEDADDTVFKNQVEQLIKEAEGEIPSEISKKLSELASRKVKTTLPFQRIVLYIDDVDRCPPEKVLEVLQAVHMLLAFKLFVVFVAVDVRWVASSLAQQYRGMLRQPDKPGEVTSASDYLEKIFQVPYWVPGVDSTTADWLLTDILDDGKPSEVPEGVPRTEEELREFAKNVGGVEGVGLPREIAFDKLIQHQVEALRPYASLVRSPRKLLRLVNVVRLLNVSGHLAQDTSGSGVLRVHALVVQVTISTVVPDSYADWVRLLSRYERKTVDELLQDPSNFYESEPGEIIWSILNVFKAAERSPSWRDAAVEALLEYAPLAKRFSFAV